MTRFERFGYPAAVVLGGVLIVITALNQPYNQNEWAQIQTYGSWDPRVITSGTRQPPLDPLLGSLVQHLLGLGQLQQRLVPVTCGVLSLVLMAGLLRRLAIGAAGVVALFFMATAPLFLLYSAYTRPYALPVMLTLLAAYAGTRWLDDGGRRWWAAAVAGALLLPLSRVPEPVVFLLSSAVFLFVVGLRDRARRRRTWSLAGGFLVALVTVGAISTLTLSHQPTSTGKPLIDVNPVHALHRLPTGLRELYHFVIPQYAHWFPWWPVTLLVVVVAAVLPVSRRRLLTTWYWIPLVLGPLAFLIAYHTVNTYPLQMRHYRVRFAYFWIPSLTVLVALAAHAVSRTRVRASQWLGVALAGVLVVSQLPMTWHVLTENDAADVAQAASVIQDVVPHDAVVIYDGPSPAGYWRQPFFGSSRWFTGPHADVMTAAAIGNGSKKIKKDAGDVYLLLLDAPCVYSVACDSPEVHWGGHVDGYRVVKRFDRFTLYAPTRGQRGPSGAVAALTALSASFGPRYDDRDRAAAARLKALIARTG